MGLIPGLGGQADPSSFWQTGESNSYVPKHLTRRDDPGTTDAAVKKLTGGRINSNVWPPPLYLLTASDCFRIHRKYGSLHPDSILDIRSRRE